MHSLVFSPTGKHVICNMLDLLDKDRLVVQASDKDKSWIYLQRKKKQMYPRLPLKIHILHSTTSSMTLVSKLY